jgi:hypothetical protein
MWKQAAFFLGLYLFSGLLPSGWWGGPPLRELVGIVASIGGGVTCFMAMNQNTNVPLVLILILSIIVTVLLVCCDALVWDNP